MNIVEIPREKIEPNAYNPNIVPDSIMEQLRKNIEKNGIENPVLIRKHDTEEDKYVIIDGEHRWKIAGDLGIEVIPCTIKDIDVNEAKIQTINMNKLRGEFDSIKLAEVLKSLQEIYSPEELEEKLGYSFEELRSYDDLLNFDFAQLESNSDDIEKMTDSFEAVMLNDFSLSVTSKQLEIIETAIEVEAGSEMSKAEALEKICGKFLSKNDTEKYTEILDRFSKKDVDIALQKESELELPEDSTEPAIETFSEENSEETEEVLPEESEDKNTKEILE